MLNDQSWRYPCRRGFIGEFARQRPPRPINRRLRDVPQRHRDHRLGDALGGFSGLARRLPKRALIGAALALPSASPLIAPWTVRNYLVPRSFVPLDIPRLLLYPLLRNFFTPYTNEADLPMVRFHGGRAAHVVLAMSEAFPIPVLLLTALGLAVTFRKYWHELLFTYGAVLSAMGEVLVFYGNARFHSPSGPLLILLATGALWWITQPEPGTVCWELGRSTWVTSAHTSDDCQRPLPRPGRRS